MKKKALTTIFYFLLGLLLFTKIQKRKEMHEQSVHAHQSQTCLSASISNNKHQATIQVFNLFVCKVSPRPV